MIHHETHNVEMKDCTPIEVEAVYELEGEVGEPPYGQTCDLISLTIVDSPYADHLGRCFYLKDEPTDSLDEELLQMDADDKFKPNNL